jgi:hypothetical protein
MAELLRVEPTRSHLTGDPDGYAWFVFDDGRSYHRRLDAQEQSERGPIIMSDNIDAVMSHADGKTYTSKSALYRSYKPDGNPQGVRYECIGEQIAKPFERPKRDKAAARRAIDRTLSEMGI